MISVIVPVYQAEKSLKRCVDSILSQSYHKLEVILVDDGSTDSSGIICDQYEQQDMRVRVIHQDNAGVSAARNAGIDVSSGDFLAFVDSDDYIEPQMYEKMMSVAQKYSCDIVMCDCLKEFSNHSEIYTHAIRPGYYDKKQLEKEYYPHLLIMENIEYPPTISNWLLLIKKELHNGKSIPRYIDGVRFSEDLLFGAQLLYASESFYYMKEEYLYHYCMNQNSVTHVFKSDKWDDYNRLMEEIKKSFGGCVEYDFSKQIDLVQLFFLYNAVGEIISTSLLVGQEKNRLCKKILKSKEVKAMFHRIQVMKLEVPLKLKLLTLIYKYNVGIKCLIAWKSRK